MPPPKVTCWVCSQVVNKAQTACTGNDKEGKPMRCCKSHQEACLSEEWQKKQRHIEIMNQQRFKQQVEKKNTPWHVPKGLECWHCHRSAIRGQEHHLRMLVTHEKMILKGASPFDFDTLKQEYGEVKPVVVLVPVKVDDILVKQTQDGWSLCTMSGGHLLICQNCAKEYGLLKEWQEALCPRSNNLSPEFVLALGACLYEASGLKKLVQEKAVEEIFAPSKN